MEISKNPSIFVDRRVEVKDCWSRRSTGITRKSKRDFMEIRESVPSACSLFLAESFRKMDIGIGRVVLGKPQSIVPIFATEVVGKLQLDPEDFVEFGNDDEDITNHPLVRSVACGNSQPMIYQMDACVGSSQPDERISEAAAAAPVEMIDCCVGSSQPLVEMIDESIETTRIVVKDTETMTMKVDPQGLHKRAWGNFGFYGNDATENKKPCKGRIILGNMNTMNNTMWNSASQNHQIQGNNVRGVDYGINCGANQRERTLVYPSQINQGFEMDQQEESSQPISTVGTRVPVLRVGLSKKVRPPRLLSQCRSVPATQPERMETENYGNDEDKEN